MRIVLDTNVLVSALLKPESNPAQVLNTILNEKVTLLYDNRILLEYRKVLLRAKFGFSREAVDPLLDFFNSTGEFVAAGPITIPFQDEADKKFYEVAKTGHALFLITGNGTHYPKDPIVITPRDFILTIS